MTSAVNGLVARATPTRVVVKAALRLLGGAVGIEAHLAMALQALAVRIPA